MDRIGIACIKYFFNYRDQFYACLQEYNINENDFFYNESGNYYSNEVKRLKENGIFNKYFNVGYLTKKERFINVENIICKCISIKVKGNEDYSYFSEFDYENEHD